MFLRIRIRPLGAMSDDSRWATRTGGGDGGRSTSTAATMVGCRGRASPLAGFPKAAGASYSSGFSSRKRRSTLPVILAMLLSYPLWDSDPVQAMDPTEKNPPPPSSAQ